MSQNEQQQEKKPMTLRDHIEYFKAYGEFVTDIDAEMKRKAVKILLNWKFVEILTMLREFNVDQNEKDKFYERWNTLLQEELTIDTGPTVNP